MVRQIDRQIYRWLDRQIGILFLTSSEEWTVLIVPGPSPDTNRYIDRQIDIQMVRQIDRYIDGQTDRQIYRWLDRQIDILFLLSSEEWTVFIVPGPSPEQKQIDGQADGYSLSALRRGMFLMNIQGVSPNINR